jgi:hypothetical protein
VDLSVDQKPKQTIIKEEPKMHNKRYDTTIILASGLISSVLIVGILYLAKGKKQ